MGYVSGLNAIIRVLTRKREAGELESKKQK